MVRKEKITIKLKLLKTSLIREILYEVAVREKHSQEN